MGLKGGEPVKPNHQNRRLFQMLAATRGQTPDFLAVVNFGKAPFYLDRQAKSMSQAVEPLEKRLGENTF
jgi:hypothetical protein